MRKELSAGLSALAIVASAPCQRQPTNILGSTTSHALAAAGTSVFVLGSTQTGALFTRSLDGGGTWLAPLSIGGPNSCSGSDAKVAVRGDSVFAVWERYCSFYAPCEVCFNRSLDGGATWLGAPLTQPFVSGNAHSVSPEVVATTNAVCVFWLGKLQPGGPSYVHCRVSTDNGASWSPVKILSGNAGSAGRLRVACDGSGVFLTWLSYVAPNNQPYFNRSLDDGATWFPQPIRLNTNVALGAHDARDAEIAVAGNNVTAIFRDPRDWPGAANSAQGDIYCNHSTDGGTTWGGDVRVGPGAPGTTECLEPHLAVEGTNAYVVWREPLNTYWGVKIKRSTDSGATWQPTEARLDNGPGAATGFPGRPRVAASADAVLVAWTESRPNSSMNSVFANRSLDGGVTWLPTDVELMDNSPSNLRVEVAVDGTAAYVASIASTNVRHTIPFGFVPYGGGTAGSGGIEPRLVGNGTAGIGETVAIDIQDGLGGAPAVLGAGASKASQPFFGGTLLVVPDFVFGFVLGGSGAGNGSTSMPIQIPNTPALLGDTWNFQGLVLDPGSASGAALSHALELWVG